MTKTQWRPVFAASTIILSALCAASSSNADQAPGLEYATVGHVLTEGIGSCGFVAIGADLAMTAAHCVIKSGATEPVHPSSIRLEAKPHNKPVQTLYVSDIATHPSFSFDVDPTRQTVGQDVALLRLTSSFNAPFETTVVAPTDITFAGLLPIEEGAAVFQADACPIRVETGNVLVLDCARIPGTSGSPIFAMIDGKRGVIGVISAGGTKEDGTEITFGVNAVANFSHLSWLMRDRGAVGKF